MSSFNLNLDHLLNDDSPVKRRTIRQSKGGRNVGRNDGQKVVEMTGKSSSTTKKAAGKSKSGRNVGRLSDDSPDEMTGKSSSIAPQFLATKSPMGKTTLRLDDETRAVLSELTQRYGVTAGAVVKTALLDFVKKNRLLA